MLQHLEPRRPWQEKAAQGEARAEECVHKAAQQFWMEKEQETYKFLSMNWFFPESWIMNNPVCKITRENKK